MCFISELWFLYEYWVLGTKPGVAESNKCCQCSLHIPRGLTILVHAGPCPAASICICGSWGLLCAEQVIRVHQELTQYPSFPKVIKPRWNNSVHSTLVSRALRWNWLVTHVVTSLITNPLFGCLPCLTSPWPSYHLLSEHLLRILVSQSASGEPELRQGIPRLHCGHHFQSGCGGPCWTYHHSLNPKPGTACGKAFLFQPSKS